MKKLLLLLICVTCFITNILSKNKPIGAIDSIKNKATSSFIYDFEKDLKCNITDTFYLKRSIVKNETISNDLKIHSIISNINISIVNSEMMLIRFKNDGIDCSEKIYGYQYSFYYKDSKTLKNITNQIINEYEKKLAYIKDSTENAEIKRVKEESIRKNNERKNNERKTYNTDHDWQVGPRGGIYYINSNGKKTYKRK